LVSVPPRVISATDLTIGKRAASMGQPRTAVEAGVVVGGDASIVGAYHEHGLVADRVLDEVARIRDLFLATGDLPHARPEPLHLEVEEGLRDVALLGHEAVGPH